ncbi:hypothetical protein [Lysinibacillus sphaericus]|uniref:hypothetical protein n=1 Tax=Lysinibacillus sphaericus TaxID=1421 RepID=UPI001A9EACD9|nr:hypothetical protein [Lysinibacillus sphaericus]QTB25217.1 hypothetical protein J2D51_12665 [Lysinibacillus sphaericus]
METVFVHLHDKNDFNYVNEYYQFKRVPVEGEYLVTNVDGDWYKVELVVHTPTSKEMIAELYAVKVDHNEEINKKTKL